MIFLDTSGLEDGTICLCLTGTAEARPEKQYLPAYYFDICRCDGTRVGTCDLRIGRNEKIEIGGNIGYTVFPPYRGHHYAARAVRLLKTLAARHGMAYLTISCVPENAASARTCELAGGVLTGIVPVPMFSEMYAEGKRFVRVYRFELPVPEAVQAESCAN